jgi:16S rRNA (guanine527-N7)-methyltransferase
VTLAESQGKKSSFLREAVRTLGLNNAEVYAGRVETLDRQFEAVTLRAVDKMLDACRTAVQKLAPRGYFLPFTTLNGAPAIRETFPEMEWSAPLLLTGSGQRILLQGQKRR